MAAITIQQEVQEFFAELSGDDGCMSIEQYNNEIDESLPAVAQGNFITQDDMERLSAQWHKKQ